MPDRSTELVQGPPRATASDEQTGRGPASMLLEAQAVWVLLREVGEDPPEA